MFFKLPIELEVKILREYIPIKDKYSLLQIKPFQNILTEKYCWKDLLKVSSKNLPLHSTHLIEKIEPGVFVKLPRNAVYQVSVNYSTATVIITEFRNKILVNINDAPYGIKIKNHSIEKIHEYLDNFYKFSQKVEFNHVYETWNRYIITFNLDTRILYINDTKQFQMMPCHINTFCTTDKNVFLLKERNLLIIFFVKQTYFIRDMCIYLDIARYLGNKEFNYKYPTIGPLVTIIKAYSFKKNFKRATRLHLNYKPRKHNIQIKISGKYNCFNQMYKQFHLD